MLDVAVARVQRHLKIETFCASVPEKHKSTATVVVGQLAQPPSLVYRFARHTRRRSTVSCRNSGVASCCLVTAVAQQPDSSSGLPYLTISSSLDTTPPVNPAAFIVFERVQLQTNRCGVAGVGTVACRCFADNFLVHGGVASRREIPIHASSP